MPAPVSCDPALRGYDAVHLASGLSVGDDALVLVSPDCELADRDTHRMESANLELVRSTFAAWERGDFSDTGWAHPEIEFVIADGPSPGSWRGLAGMAEGWRGIMSAWDRTRVEAVDEYRVIDDERILVLVHQGGRGKASGLELGHMRSKGAAVFHVRDGKVTRLVVWLDRERGLADLGLPSKADSSRA